MKKLTTAERRYYLEILYIECHPKCLRRGYKVVTVTGLIFKKLTPDKQNSCTEFIENPTDVKSLVKGHGDTEGRGLHTNSFLLCVVGTS
jgi:hypothetical protein